MPFFFSAPATMTAQLDPTGTYKQPWTWAYPKKSYMFTVPADRIYDIEWGSAVVAAPRPW